MPWNSTPNSKITVYTTIITLPETYIASKNGWLEYSFPFGRVYFSVGQLATMLALGRVLGNFPEHIVVPRVNEIRFHLFEGPRHCDCWTRKCSWLKRTSLENNSNKKNLCLVSSARSDSKGISSTKWYGFWKKSCTTWDAYNPKSYKSWDNLPTSTGLAGFLPFTV